MATYDDDASEQQTVVLAEGVYALTQCVAKHPDRWNPITIAVAATLGINPKELPERLDILEAALIKVLSADE